MAPRKTISVEAVKANANRMLRDSVDDAKEGRIGIFILLERILLDTDNYKGYRYISPNDDKRPVPEEGLKLVNFSGQVDDTRRFYY